ncbi:helix-turn-helix transcriptional regulator [Asticcacaulis sp. ZE23SCel15]|uniref:response regulator transcription factor n=1 Tax=Asticcacaulis sp. ZE23SCel15 TaxID=3059027 RepID=UPI00265E7433|nr:helix-turn-helix transcriptional regulator [Asticcacaulis sp. ZE23SCel15]WKL55993.1 helix-turn-helix transcriptional regulator [Asticcacaulis sp. ZE23SCel15]
MGESLSKFDVLTPRQKEVLRLTSQHLLAKEIARKLEISEHTVKTHKEKARKLLGAQSSVQAALMLAHHEAHPLIPPEGYRASEGIARQGFETSSLGHEQYNPNQKRTQFDDPKERSGGSDVELNSHRESARYSPNFEHDIQSEGRGRGNSGGNNADVRSSRFDQYLALIDRLQKYSLIQWAGLTLAVTLMIVIAAGSVVVVLMGVFQAITNFSGQTG